MDFLMEPEKCTMKVGKALIYESDEESDDDMGFGLFSPPIEYDSVSNAISAPLSPTEIEINEISSQSVLEPVHSSVSPALIPATDGRYEDLLDLQTTESRSEARKSDWSPFVLGSKPTPAKMSAETYSSNSPFAQTPPPPPSGWSWGGLPGQTQTQYTAVNQSMSLSAMRPPPVPVPLPRKCSHPPPPPPPPLLGAPMRATLQPSSVFGFGQTPTQHTAVHMHSAPIQPQTYAAAPCGLFGSAETVMEEDKGVLRHSRSAPRRLLAEQQKSRSHAVSFGFGGGGSIAPPPPPSMAAPPSTLPSSSGFGFGQTPTQHTAVHMHSAPIQPHTYAAAPCGLFGSAETVMEEDKGVIRLSRSAPRRLFAKQQTFSSHAVRFGFGGHGGMFPPPQPPMATPPSTLQSSLGFSFGQTPTQDTSADMRSAHIPCDLLGSAETVMEKSEPAIPHSAHRLLSEEQPESLSRSLSIDFGGRGRMALEHRDGEREKIPEDLAVSQEVQLESLKRFKRSGVQRRMPKKGGFSQGFFDDNMSKWPRIFTLQQPDGYWELSPALGTLLNCDISRFADDFLKRKGIASLGMKAHSDILKLLATLLVLQLMRLEKLMEGQLLRTLFCLEDTNFRPDHWEAVNRAVKWAHWADRQYPCVYSRLEFGLSWESSTKQLLGAEKIHQCSPLTGLNLNPRPTMVQS